MVEETRSTSEEPKKSAERMCTCDLVDFQEKDKADDHTAQLLYGFDVRFDLIRSSTTLRKPLLFVEESYNLLRQNEDIQQQKKTKERSGVMAFSVNTKMQNIDELTSRLIYRDWWGNISKGRNNQAKNQIANVKVLANAVWSSVKTFQPTMISESDRAAVSGLSNDQWETVLRVLNATLTSSAETLSGMPLFSDSESKPLWILDTGASHHMTSNLQLLKNVRSIPPVNIILADDTERLAIKEGTVHLGDNLVLKSVFLVEELMTDLISMGQLLDKNNCVVQMAKKFMIIQDQNLKTIIGLGKRHNGTFYFQGVDMATVCAAKTYSDSNL